MWHKGPCVNLPKDCGLFIYVDLSSVAGGGYEGRLADGSGPWRHGQAGFGGKKSGQCPLRLPGRARGPSRQREGWRFFDF